MTKKVYSAVKLPQETLDLLEEAGLQVEAFDRLGTPSEEEILEHIREVEGLISGVNVTISPKMIEAASQLKIIANIGAGVNNIALDTAQKNQVQVTRTPGQNSVASTAETALALMLALSRGIVKNQKMVQDNSFKGWQVTGFLGGHQVAYKKLFIVGFGNIGQELARMAKGLHMDMAYYDPKGPAPFKAIEEETGARFVDFERGLREADYVVLQMNYTEDNHHLMGPDQLAQMKEGAYLINTARGGIVDEKALYRALKEGKLAGAALDNHEEEPHINPDLASLDQVVLTPHIGNDTYEARLEMAQTAAQDLIRVLEGKEPKYGVEG
ncbi:MAG: NAD(P)-dependent oxidoreductase [Tissierellia bacterium]|nr:NAD(P)-dependent oxidoreductase [Tissierellia bacterium]